VGKEKPRLHSEARGRSGDSVLLTVHDAEVLVQPTSDQTTKLISCLSPERLAPYYRGNATSHDSAVRLYLWNLRLTAAFTEIIAVAEVVLRNAMHRELTETFGAQWYCRADLFDDRTLSELTRAWNQVNLPDRSIATVPVGKFIAETMLGLWINLLDAGGHRGRAPARVNVDYEEQLWRPALYRAFPNSNKRRKTVHRTASQLRALRNRTAHHEPLLNGVPLHGEYDRNRNPRRLTVAQAHEAVLDLVRYVDTDIHAWLASASRVTQVNAERM
jgi:hypothetical protein